MVDNLRVACPLGVLADVGKVNLSVTGLANRSSRGASASASEGWYRYGDSNPGPVAENHVS